MEAFDLPTLDGFHLIPGLCDGVALGIEAITGFPFLNSLLRAALSGHRHVNVHGSESRNKSMIVHIKTRNGRPSTRDGDERMFITWPFLQEGGW